MQMRHPLPARRLARIGLAAPLLAAFAGCALLAHRAPPPSDWGIEIVGLRQSAGGAMLDFRYRVTDAEKARPLLERSTSAYLVDQASGRRLTVPNPPKIGPLRQTSRALIPGRTYFILFSNTGRSVAKGSRVTVVIGEFRAEDLVVE